jgi:hypothetical protein
MTTRIKTVLAAGLVAVLASPAFAALDVEANPVASGRYLAGTPGPTAAPIIVVAHAGAIRATHTNTSSSDAELFDRAVGHIR